MKHTVGWWDASKPAAEKVCSTGVCAAAHEAVVGGLQADISFTAFKGACNTAVVAEPTPNTFCRSRSTTGLCTITQ
jgi:hypothetical protein